MNKTKRFFLKRNLVLLSTDTAHVQHGGTNEPEPMDVDEPTEDHGHGINEQVEGIFCSVLFFLQYLVI